jgi:hypothetical protein
VTKIAKTDNIQETFRSQLYSVKMAGPKMSENRKPEVKGKIYRKAKTFSGRPEICFLLVTETCFLNSNVIPARKKNMSIR